MTDENNGRKSHTTWDGIALERAALYLPREVWQQLFALCRDAKLSSSRYIERLILEKLQ